jgi:hypothetical protein
MYIILDIEQGDDRFYRYTNQHSPTGAGEDDMNMSKSLPEIAIEALRSAP